MPLVTSYQVISDDPNTVGGDSLSDVHFQFQIPDDVTPRGAAILAFRVNPNPEGTSTLQVRLNDDVLLRQPFDSEPQRSWHEVFSSSSLKKDGNELTISTNTGEGSFTVSDIVLFFQTSI
jgi:hypothetical protein